MLISHMTCLIRTKFAKERMNKSKVRLLVVLLDKAYPFCLGVSYIPITFYFKRRNGRQIFLHWFVF